MSTTISNTIASQAYRGQTVRITLGVGQIPELYNIMVGQTAINPDNNTVIGVISEVDLYGNSFKITPVQPNLRFDTISTPGILRYDCKINIS